MKGRSSSQSGRGPIVETRVDTVEPFILAAESSLRSRRAQVAVARGTPFERAEAGKQKAARRRSCLVILGSAKL
jgi:hypothetical protein